MPPSQSDASFIHRPAVRVACVAGIVLGLATAASAQSGLAGYHEYPQFRTMNGLPGSTFPVTKGGDVHADGAIALSTPVAYSLGPMRFVLGGMAVAEGRRPSFSPGVGSDTLRGNGTLQTMVGSELGRYGHLTSSVLFLSGVRDNVFNFHWMPPQEGDRLTYAVGILDLLGDGGASGENSPGDRDNSTSPYGVVTYELGTKGAYFSAGWGARRFRHGFANLSATVLPNVKAYTELDFDRLNVGAAYVISMPSDGRRTPALALTAGLVHGKHGAVGLNFSW